MSRTYRLTAENGDIMQDMLKDALDESGWYGVTIEELDDSEMRFQANRDRIFDETARQAAKRLVQDFEDVNGEAYDACIQGMQWALKRTIK